jgi:hypothetical protein
MIAQGWMLLRLMFFAWILLGTGQGWRRPLALVIIAAVFWAINAGGIGNNMRDAVRAWWESVVGLPGQPQVQQDHGVIRQTLRPAERLLALLIASLWPGVGERTVTARREAEERQRREEGERQQAEAERQRLLLHKRPLQRTWRTAAPWQPVNSLQPQHQALTWLLQDKKSEKETRQSLGLVQGSRPCRAKSRPHNSSTISLQTGSVIMPK